MTNKSKKEPVLTLGAHLQNLRNLKKMTLRQVEEASNKTISNAYLSQLENNHISQPSPNILHTLAELYGTVYQELMEKAGYISASKDRSDSHTHGRIATLAKQSLTKGEEDALIEYLAFLRSRRGDKK